MLINLFEGECLLGLLVNDQEYFAHGPLAQLFAEFVVDRPLVLHELAALGVLGLLAVYVVR